MDLYKFISSEDFNKQRAKSIKKGFDEGIDYFSLRSEIVWELKNLAERQELYVKKLNFAEKTMKISLDEGNMSFFIQKQLQSEFFDKEIFKMGLKMNYYGALLNQFKSEYSGFSLN